MLDVRDLGEDDLFIRLGIARRSEQHGRVEHDFYYLGVD